MYLHFLLPLLGGSKGIGLTIAENLVREGVNVSYCARTTKDTDFSDFHSSLPASNTARAYGTSLDISSRTAIADWVSSAAERFGRIDVIIANASQQLLESTPENWQKSFDIDVMGFVSLVECSLPWLEKSPCPSVIVQSSFMGREVYRPPAAPYGACKAAQLQHVQELSHTLGPKGIRVNAISPGPILAPGGPWELYSKIAPEWVEEQRQKIPLKRLGNTQEVANVALFLASPLSGFVSGTNLLADGGIHVGTQF